MYCVYFINNKERKTISRCKDLVFMQKPGKEGYKKREECECEPNTSNGLMGIAQISWKLVN